MTTSCPASLLAASTIDDPALLEPDTFYYTPSSSSSAPFDAWRSSPHAYNMTADRHDVLYARVFEPHPKRLAEERARLGRRGKHVKIPKVFVRRNSGSRNISQAAAVAAAWRAEHTPSPSPSPSPLLSTRTTRASTSSGRSVATSASSLSVSERLSSAGKAVRRAISRRT